MGLLHNSSVAVAADVVSGSVMPLTGKSISGLFTPHGLEQRCLAQDEQTLARQASLISDAIRQGCFDWDVTLYLALSRRQPQPLLLSKFLMRGALSGGTIIF